MDRRHAAVSTVRQCALLSISRSSLNYRRKGTCPEDLTVMKAMDQQAGAGAQDLSLSTGRHGDHPAQPPSAEGWTADITYLPMAKGLLYLVLPRKDGLVQPVCSALEAIEYPGSRLLCRSPGGSLE